MENTWIQKDNDGRITYFDIPTQVKFADFDVLESDEDFSTDNMPYIGGIGFGDNIICGCCGALLSLEDIYEAAKEWEFDGEAIKVYDNWVDLDETIRGDE